MRPVIKVVMGRNVLPNLDKAIKAEVLVELRSTAAAVRDAARATVPVRTGALQRSIRYHVDGATGNFTVSAGMFYAGFVEWGTRFMAARPYLTPAYYQYVPQMLPRIKAIIERVAAA